MGLLLLLHQCYFTLDITMKVQVMSNQIRSSSQSQCCHGESETVVPVSFMNFDNVDDLKTSVQADAAHDDLLSVSADAHNVINGEDNGGGQDEITSSDCHSVSSSRDCLPPNSIEQAKQYSCDGLDAAVSVSTDTALEPNSHDLHLKTQEGRLYSLSLSIEGNKTGSYRSASPTDRKVMSAKNTSCNKILPPAVFTDELRVELGSSAQFSKVLENISLPLLYIPTTRQLVTGGGGLAYPDQSTSPQKDVLYAPERDYLYSGSESASSTLDLSSSELSSTHSPMHKAHSAQEFHYLVKCRDTDRLTLHSVDSYPGNENSFEPGTHLFADNSSLSSVSTGTDFSVSAISATESDFIAESKSLSHDAADESVFVDVNLHSRNSFDKGYNSSSLDSGYGDKRAPMFQAARKKSFTGLKSFFTRKVKEESPPGWKLFGRIPPKPVAHRQTHEITSEFQTRQRKIEKPSFSSAGKKQGTEVMSTTALILESRPVNLPTKKPEEIEKHKHEYEEMVEAAKRKEMKDLKLKRKLLQQQRKYEDQMMASARVWDLEILPNWETMRNTKRTRELWWMGLPPNVRGRVWQLAVGNDLNITHTLYNICHERAEERIRFVQEEGASQGHAGLEASSGHQEPSNKESSVQVIKLDVSRTFPHLCIFQKGGPFYDLLHNLLGAYACYRPDIGYVQGMSFIAAVFLLNMDVADAFVCFANLLNRPCQLAFFRMDENLMMAYYRTFEEFLKDNLPKLYAHFNSLGVTPNLYLMEWVFLIYSKSLPLDVACRVWDVFFRDGEEFLFRTALAILKIHESVLLKMDFIHAAQFLTKLPEDVSCEQLFKEIDSVRMSIDKRGFHAVHAFFKDLHASGS